MNKPLHPSFLFLQFLVFESHHRECTKLPRQRFDRVSFFLLLVIKFEVTFVTIRMCTPQKQTG